MAEVEWRTCEARQKVVRCYLVDAGCPPEIVVGELTIAVEVGDWVIESLDVQGKKSLDVLTAAQFEERFRLLPTLDEQVKIARSQIICPICGDTKTLKDALPESVWATHKNEFIERHRRSCYCQPHDRQGTL